MTGGLALLPASARAQTGGGGDLDYSRAMPVVPLPIYHERPEDGGLYVFTEFTMIRQTRNLGNQVVARRGFVDVDGSVQAGLTGQFGIDASGLVFFQPGPPGPPGQFFGSGVQALNVSDLNKAQLTYAPGLILGLGWRFHDGSAAEFRWKQTVSSRYNVGADIIPQGFAVGNHLLDSFLFSPVFNFPSNYAGEPQNLALGNPGATYGIWNAAASETIEFMQRFTQQDITYRVPVRQDDISRVNVTVGERFAWIWERFLWRTVSQDFAGQAQPSDVAIYSNVVSNRMYGPTLGCEYELYIGRGFALTFHVDGAAYLDVVKERAQFSLADRSTEAKRQVIEYTFAPALNGELHLDWFPFEGVQVRIGWNSVAFFNTVNAPNPLPYTPDGVVGIDFGNLNGNWQRKAIRYLDGIDVGLAITF
jgi:hypothetical protein